MNTLITQHDILPLYDLAVNAVLVEYSKHTQFAGVGDTVSGKIYRCNDGATARELFEKIAADGEPVIIFNADDSYIEDANI